MKGFRLEFYIFISIISDCYQNVLFPSVSVAIKTNGKIITNTSITGNFTGSFDEIILGCNSTYPNKWTFPSNPLKDGDLVGIAIDKSRRVEDINDNSTYTFFSELTLIFKNPTIDQFLSCTHVTRAQERHQSTAVQLISGPNSGALFVDIEKGKNVNSKEGANSRFGANPDCTLILHFDDKSSEYGCSSHFADDSEENLISRVVPCRNSDECNAIIRNDNCTDSLVQSCNVQNCQTMPKLKPGAIICQYGKFSVARAVFTTVEDPPSYYVKNLQSRVKISQVLKLQIQNGSLFERQLISVTCSGAASYFSKGFRLTLFEVDKVDDIDPKEITELYSADGQTYNAGTVIRLNSTRIKGIICFAPVWNSYRWENVSIGFVVRAIPPPTLVDEKTIEAKTVPEHESVTMRCDLVEPNVPTVRFDWLRNNKMLKKPRSGFKENKVYDIQDTDNFTTLIIFDLSVDTNFTCEATNQNTERRQRRFMVKVDYKSTEGAESVITQKSSEGSLTLILLIGGGTLLLFLIILIFFLFRINRNQSQWIRMTEEEIKEFVDGDPNSENALFYPYNPQYELAMKDFQIDSKVLGSGQFGIVHKGRLGKAPIAIKSAKKGADIAYVKALLSELKIMSYVGRHDNIVCLIGACTQNIQKCEVYIICEFCANGNMLNFVKASRRIFVDHNQRKAYGSFRKSTVDYQNSTVKKLSSKDLIRWAYEIACGMEFLSSKKVVHGDLAARNVLLTRDLTAKVGDFGLAKQLFQYSVYVQRQECPLPLKWMAVESLQDLEFSVQSDVWSYGITLYEIFTLGQCPYPGINWGFDSWKMLRDGYRMDKPQYATESTYKVMLQCWNLDLNQRPDFISLKEFFLQQGATFQGKSVFK